MKVGILGGTFNPPHIGHLILAQEALGRLQLDKVFFIPANSPPHKNKGYLDSRLRLKMVKLAISDNLNFEALDIEIKRKGVSYTVDTITELQKIYSGAHFYLIIGSDLANNFDQWVKAEKIKKMSTVVVAERKEAPLINKNDFSLVKITQIGISSSLIRQRAKDSKSIKYLVPERVERYIKENNLYL